MPCKPSPSSPCATTSPWSRTRCTAASGTPPFVQLAGLAALTGSQECVAAALARLERRRDWLVQGLNGLPGVRCSPPGGAFYAFPDVSKIEERAGLSTPQLAARL